ESSRLLSEENGYVHLKNLQKMLRMRQQYMTSQISILYPVKLVVGPAQEQELEAYPLGGPAGNSPA
ncbi:UV radiation resistance-associated gene protein-like, partial [Trifolium medium]|nr:UV radiation resistance-associated gene protein-like [Trifolium medium]